MQYGLEVVKFEPGNCKIFHKDKEDVNLVIRKMKKIHKCDISEKMRAKWRKKRMRRLKRKRRKMR